MLKHLIEMVDDNKRNEAKVIAYDYIRSGALPFSDYVKLLDYLENTIIDEKLKNGELLTNFTL